MCFVCDFEMLELSRRNFGSFTEDFWKFHGGILELFSALEKSHFPGAESDSHRGGALGSGGPVDALWRQTAKLDSKQGFDAVA